MARRVADTRSPDSRLAGLPALVLSLGAVAMALAPDAKVSRFKLEAVELSAAAVLAAVGARAVVEGKIGRPPRGLGIAVALWLGVTLALTLAAADGALAVGELMRVATAAAAFAGAVLAGLDGRRRRLFFGAWTGAAALVSVYALLQRAGGAGPLLVPQISRPIGTFGNPIFLAAYLVPSLFIGAGLWRTATTAARFPLGASLALEAGALTLTQTRSAWLALAAAAVLLAWRRPALRGVAAVVLVAGVVAVGAIGARDQAHLLIWRDTVRLWRTSPWTGVGPGAFHVQFPDVAGADLKAKWPKGQSIVNEAHNEYLQTLAEGGPVALAAELAVLGALLFLFLRRTDDSLWIGAAALAGFAQNVASADFRFGVSLAMTLLLAGVFATAGDEEAATIAVPPIGRALAGAGAAGAIAIGVSRAGTFARERAAAAEPGFFQERLVNPARAISELQTAAAERRQDPAELERLAFVYAKEMVGPDGKPNPAMGAKAAEAFRGVIALDPKRASAHNNLANTLFTMGNAAGAAAEWREAARLDGRYVDPRLNLGKTAYLRGDLKESARWFQDVLRIDPGNAEAQMYLRRMVE